MPFSTHWGGTYLPIVSLIPFWHNEGVPTSSLCQSFLFQHIGEVPTSPLHRWSPFDTMRRYLPPCCVGHFFFDALGRFLPPHCVVDPFLMHRGGQHLPVVSLIPFQCSEEVLASRCVGHLFFDALGRLWPLIYYNLLCIYNIMYFIRYTLEWVYGPWVSTKPLPQPIKNLYPHYRYGFSILWLSYLPQNCHHTWKEVSEFIYNSSKCGQI